MSIRLVALAAAAAATVVGCGQPGPAAPGADGPVTVVTSTDVWASVVTAVGGDEVGVQAIVAGQAGDPHSYQVSAKDAAILRGAELVVFNGGGYDDFVEQSLGDDASQGGPRRIRAVDLRPAQNRMAGPGDEAANEHVWYDLPTVASVAVEIATQLGELRPSAKATFAANAEAFGGKIEDLEAKVQELAAAHGGTAVAATEPVAEYLLDAAKLTDATPAEFVAAVEEETDPPAAAVAEIQRLVRERRVAMVVHNPQTETPVVADLVTTARAAGLPVVELTETLPAGQDYPTWMATQIRALFDALAGT